MCERVDDGSRKFYVDHDHECCARGSTRGRAATVSVACCARCNTALGVMEDPEYRTRVERATAYVQSYRDRRGL